MIDWNEKPVKAPVDLESCPFCKTTLVCLVYNGETSYVQCTQCGARGGLGATLEEASENWNLRGIRRVLADVKRRRNTPIN